MRSHKQVFVKKQLLVVSHWLWLQNHQLFHSIRRKAVSRGSRLNNDEYPSEYYASH